MKRHDDCTEEDDEDCGECQRTDCRYSRHYDGPPVQPPDLDCDDGEEYGRGSDGFEAVGGSTGYAGR